MLSSFLNGVGQLTNQNLLYVGFITLVAGGAFIGSKKLAEGRSPYLILVGIWVALALLVSVANDGGGMRIMFTNPISIAIIGLIAGAGKALYRRLE
jgi:hypothetical protein